MQVDPQGGYVPEHQKRARRVDLITLPRDVAGTNCGNCSYFIRRDDQAKNVGELMGQTTGECTHRDVQMPVTSRMCCEKWDAPGTLRHHHKETQ